jgi:hypothetical protein
MVDIGQASIALTAGVQAAFAGAHESALMVAGAGWEEIADVPAPERLRSTASA